MCCTGRMGPSTSAFGAAPRHPSPADRWSEPLVALALGYLLVMNLLVFWCWFTRRWSLPDPWYWSLVAFDIALPALAGLLVLRHRASLSHDEQVLLDRLPSGHRDALRRAVRTGAASSDPHEARLQRAMARSMQREGSWQVPWYMFPAGLWPAVNLADLPPHGIWGLLSIACWAGALTACVNRRRAQDFLVRLATPASVG